MSDFFDELECAQAVDKAYPDDIAEWPKMVRLAAFASRDRILRSYPERRVTEETSCCMDRSDPRFPDGVPAHLSHMLVFKIKLDQPVDPEIRWNDADEKWEPAA